MNKHGVEELLLALGVTEFTNRKSEVDFPCPFAPWTHKGLVDDRPSAGISVGLNGTKSYFNCFTCNRKGSLYVMVKQLCDLDMKFEKALTLVEDERATGMEAELSNAMRWYSPEQVVQEKPEGRVWSEKELEAFEKPEKEVLDYLSSRGIKDAVATAAKWEVCYDLTERRLAFPVRSIDGKLVGIVGRTLNATNPKYKNYWKFQKSLYLYGEHKLTDECDKMYVMEGMLDVVKASQVLKNCVGLFGCEMSKRQEDRILRQKKAVYLLLDGDEAGGSAKRQIISKLRGRSQLFDCEMLYGHDPASLSESDLLDLVTQASLIL